MMVTCDNALLDPILPLTTMKTAIHAKTDRQHFTYTFKRTISPYPPSGEEGPWYSPNCEIRDFREDARRGKN
jgi:hypothetical protein